MTTKIEWTDETWNPVSGCTKISDGCKHCYAERLWCRLSAPGQPYDGRKFTDVKCHPERLTQPLHWEKPRRIFVNSMSDLFHEDVPDHFIIRVLGVINRKRQHTFQILTKRPERALKFFHNYGLIPDPIIKATPSGEVLSSNIWLGVSIEDQQTADERIPLLLQTPAAVRWLSIEPMLGQISLTNISFDTETLSHLDALHGTYICDGLNEPRTTPRINWVVVGGESGPKARPMHPDWVRSVRDQCQAADVPFFFKQWGNWSPVDLDTARNVTDWMIVDKHGDIDIPDYRTPRKEIGEVAMRQVSKKQAGRTLDGRTWEEYPDAP